jgi:APA family basic amino acid/polyamine antiporter
MSTAPSYDPAVSAAREASARDAPAPTLSVFDATMITVGIVIGAGIFETPVLVASIAGSPGPMLLAWVLGGVLSFIGALTYAELATTYPSAGGDYTFLTRAYGKSVSFLFAWARSTVICTGSIALLGFILGDYLTRLFPLGSHSSALAALTLGDGTSAVANVNASEPATGTAAFGLAMVFVLLTYGGWNEAAYVSAEVRGGPRAVLRMLLLSIAIITAVYLLFVFGILRGLGFEALKSSHAVGVDVAERALGAVGAQIVGLLVAVSSLTSMNSTMIAGARTNYSVAHDWPALGFMGAWQGRRSTPAMGFIVQAAIALALIGFGALEKDGFAAMVEFTAPVFWLFFMLSGLALFILRRREPTMPRPFRVPLYPVLPLLFVLSCGYVLYSSIVHAQTEHATHVAFGVMLSGGVVLLLLRRRR